MGGWRSKRMPRQLRRAQPIRVGKGVLCSEVCIFFARRFIDCSVCLPRLTLTCSLCGLRCAQLKLAFLKSEIYRLQFLLTSVDADSQTLYFGARSSSCVFEIPW